MSTIYLSIYRSIYLYLSIMYSPEFTGLFELVVRHGVALLEHLMQGGSSGGPWLFNGSVFSVNSWGYMGAPGMAGPFLHGTSAELLFQVAQQSEFGPPSPCLPLPWTSPGP